MISNEVDIKVTDTQVTDTITKLNEARAILKDALVASLTPEQRESLFKMGTDSIRYVTENYNYAQDPDMQAKGIDIDAWGNDITAFNQLQKIFNVVQPLYFDMLDMMTIVGSEAMEAAQANYRYLRFAAAEGTPKARAAYEALKEMRWNKTGGGKKIKAS